MTTNYNFEQSLYGFDDKLLYQDQIAKASDPSFYELDGVMKRYVAFNLFFLFLCIAEIFAVAIFFAALAQTMVVALSLALVFFTLFSYFTLRIYFQTKKPEQLKIIKENYIEACKGVIGYQEGNVDNHIALASACCRLANKLHAREYDLYHPPRLFASLTPFMERFSCWWHWEDIHYMKELLLQESVNEQIKIVKSRPTSLEAHASLANAYVMLSGLYIDPRKMEGYDEERWIPEDKFGEAFYQKFRTTAERAIEEFKILSEYAPDDAWVHNQLAYSYHDLQMPLEEIKEYETIQKLHPADKDNLFKLGVLYFQQGFNAKGLHAYQELKKAHYSRADSLIKYYGSYRT